MEIRRKDRILDAEAAAELLERAEWGVLSTASVEGEPYGVPLNFVWVRDNSNLNGVLYFHCALEGHKLSNLKANPRASFCVVGDVELLPAKFSTKYKSVIALGRVSAVEDVGEFSRAYEALLAKLDPAHLAEGLEYVRKAGARTHILRFDIDEITAKGRVK